MSPFFRRKSKKHDSAPERDAERQSARNLGAGAESDSALSDSTSEAFETTGAKNTADGIAKGDAGVVRTSIAGEPGVNGTPSGRTQSRDELMDIACSTWRDELTAKVLEADREADDARDSGQIDITRAHPTGSANLYSGMETRLSSLIREPHALERAKKRLAQLRTIVAKIEEEHGYAPISLSVGRVSWTQLPEQEESPSEWTDAYELTGELRLAPSDMPRITQQMRIANNARDAAEQPSNEPRVATECRSAALLQRMRVHFLADGDAKLQLSSQVRIDPSLEKAFRSNGIPAEDVAQLRQMASHSRNADEIIARLIELGRIYLPGFSFEDQAVIGFFTSPAQTMLADFEAMAPYLRSSGVMAAVAGDAERRRRSSIPLPAGLEGDRLPEAERGAGDHDVAELDVVEAVASGRSLVIDAAPGTERAGVIASITADAAASGKSLIYIPSRASAGKNLRAELEKIGLGELVLDFTNLEAVPLRLRTGLRLNKPEIDADALLELREELVDTRSKLSTFVDDLHTIDPEWGVSVHDMLEKLARLTAGPNAPKTRVRLGEKAIEALKGDGYQDVERDLGRAAELGVFDAVMASSAWAKSPISDDVEGAEALERARRLSTITVPATISQAARAAGETGLRQANNLAEWFEQIGVLEGISESLDTFKPHVFETSPMDMAIATATKEWRERHGHTMKAGERRALKREAESLVRPGVTPRDLHSALMLVQERREIWRRYTHDGGWPTLPDGLTQIRNTRDEVRAELEVLSAQVGGLDFVALPFSDLEARLKELVTDAPHMDSLPERNAVTQRLNEQGFARFVEDLRNRSVAREMINAELDLANTSSIFERLITKSEVLAAFGPRDISNLLVRLRELDSQHVAALAGPVQLAAINVMREVARAHRDDTLKLDSVLAQYDIGALRDAIATYARLVQVARPVWIVPPVLVADYIPPMPWADVVIADTNDSASVAGVVSTVLRGRQAVIVGDTRRSSLLNGYDDDDAAPASDTATASDGTLLGSSAIDAFSRVLPVIELPTCRVRQDELSTRALMNHGYADLYQPIPVRPSARSSRLVVVDGRGVPSASGNGAIEGTKLEVEAVVDAVVEYALDQNPDSMAVITVSPVHAQRVRDSLQEMRTTSIALDRFMNRDSAEPFTVIDISQASGVRRDHIIFSPGFGKTVHGRVLHSFGQLAQPQGLIGLVDAIEAPRSSMTVISSLGAGDIDVSRVSTPGPLLLADLLEYANGDVVSQASGEDATDSPLLDDLAERLRAAGWEAQFNYGFEGSVRIPLVAGHHDFPGTWAVAVLLDDDDYVAQASLRRRDRYRIEAFEARGWDVFQTFSTSLFIDPVGQADAIIAKLEKLRGKPADSPLSVPNLQEISDSQWIEVSQDADVQSEFGAGTGELGTLAGDTQAIKKIVAPVPRGPRPNVIPGLQLAAYTDDQLDEIVEWIASDAVPRTADQLVKAMRDELALVRRGGQYDAVLHNVVRRSGLAKADVEFVAAESAKDSAIDSAENGAENSDGSSAKAETSVADVSVADSAGVETQTPTVDGEMPNQQAVDNLEISDEPDYGQNEQA
ncbi:hypothetical protein [Arcanobacterium bovis]|uniref:DNA helicase n=1 Tax=Arcanobacterium bovis TaxID=2529275 RepID=A0A4Q9V3U9_9ACTO|nr:hypothetical protein [Arcanobacterium bovis]TBW23803.1 hypothetical protein EZJ44_01315 [Arcanobacterium bovis]